VRTYLQEDIGSKDPEVPQQVGIGRVLLLPPRAHHSRSGGLGKQHDHEVEAIRGVGTERRFETRSAQG